MTTADPSQEAGAAAARWADAYCAARVFAAAPAAVGGVLLRSPAGAVRDRWYQILVGLLDGVAPLRLPAHIDDAGLFGGTDLAATLQQGRPIQRAGLLEAARGRVLVVPMGERIDIALAARLALALDADSSPGALSLLVFDEGESDGEAVPAVLADRLGLHVDLRAIPWHVAGTMFDPDTSAGPPAPQMREVEIDEPTLNCLCALAQSLGVLSLRAVIHVAQVARILAALREAPVVEAEDASTAVRLVLCARATQAPTEAAPPDAPDAPDAPAETPGSEASAEEEEARAPEATDETDPRSEPQAGAADSKDESPRDDANGSGEGPEPETLYDKVLESIRATLPAGLLQSLPLRGGSRGSGAGASYRSAGAGRRIGVVQGRARRGERLNLVATLRRAAPWQALRARERSAGERAAEHPGQRPLIDVRRDDFCVDRTEARASATTIFVADASGSQARTRLAEAKGAVELLLHECYVRRDRVALIAFRGRTAELLLPPTRSLVRAKRCLAALPGGGGTPLAAGIEAAALLAETLLRRGETPTIVLLTDGQGNIARDGTPGRARARADAEAAAARIRRIQVHTILIDTSAHPSTAAASLAMHLGGSCLALPHARARQLAEAVTRLPHAFVATRGGHR